MSVLEQLKLDMENIGVEKYNHGYASGIFFVLSQFGKAYDNDRTLQEYAWEALQEIEIYDLHTCPYYINNDIFKKLQYWLGTENEI